MTVIRVEAPPRAYEVMVGPIAGGIGRIRDISANSKPILVSEPKVFALHGAAVAEALQADPILIPEGEAAKDWAQLHELLAAMARLGALAHLHFDHAERGAMGWRGCR